MIRRTILLALAVVLVGCGGQASWDEVLRADLEEQFADYTPEEIAQTCAGLDFLGIDTPEEVGRLVLDIGVLPPPSETVAEHAARTGDPLMFDVPPDLTIRDVVEEAGAWLLERCGQAGEAR